MLNEPASKEELISFLEALLSRYRDGVVLECNKKWQLDLLEAMPTICDGGVVSLLREVTEAVSVGEKLRFVEGFGGKEYPWYAHVVVLRCEMGSFSISKATSGSPVYRVEFGSVVRDGDNLRDLISQIRKSLRDTLEVF